MSSKRKSPPTKLEGGVGTGQNALLTPPQEEYDVKNLSPCPDETKDKASSSLMYFENVEKGCNQQSPSNNSENYSETDLSSYHSSSSPYSDGENSKQQIMNHIKNENDLEKNTEREERNDDCEGPCKKQRMTNCDDSNNTTLNSSCTGYKVYI